MKVKLWVDKSENFDVIITPPLTFEDLLAIGTRCFKFPTQALPLHFLICPPMNSKISDLSTHKDYLTMRRKSWKLYVFEYLIQTLVQYISFVKFYKPNTYLVTLIGGSCSNNAFCTPATSFLFFRFLVWMQFFLIKCAGRWAWKANKSWLEWLGHL